MDSNPQIAFLNVAGREPEGITLASEAEILGEQFTRELSRIRTPTGHRLFRMIQLLSPDESGDLRLSLNEAVLKRENQIILDGEEVALSEFIDRVPITGQEGRRGSLVASGKNERRAVRAYQYGPLAEMGLAPYASVVDIAPTLLYSLGFPVGADMDGKVLTDLFLPDHLREYPVVYVESLELSEPHWMDVPQESPVDEEFIARLHALGYIK